MTKRQKTSSSVIDNSNDSNSQDKTNKKERADNWAIVEVQTLHKGIENRRETFFGPPDQTSKKSREEAWKQITQEINAVSQCTRTVEQVMKKFKNEKCRAKRKYTDAEKNAQNSTPNTINGAGLSQQQLQHHMTTTTTTTMPSQSSINVVKLQASQNVAKTMIDIPGGHVQQIQMPNDDQNQMVIIVPEMDGMLGAINNQQHNHHGQHTLQAINNGQGVVNSAVGNHMMTRAIQSANMCSVVYSTGGDVSSNEHHMANNVATSNSNNLAIASNQISVNTPTIMHHRNSVDQGTNNQVQQGMSQHHHQLHQQQQQNQQHQHAQQQHQQQQQQQHHQNHSASLTGSSNLDSQLKNLLVNILLNRDGSGGQQVNAMIPGPDYNKQRNDILAIIANSLTKIELHMSKIAKVATSVMTQQTTPNNNNNNLNNNAVTNAIANAMMNNANNQNSNSNHTIGMPTANNDCNSKQQ